MQKTVQELLANMVNATSDVQAKDAAFDSASKAKDDALVAKVAARSALSAADAALMKIPANKFYDAGNGNVASNIDGTVIIDVIHPGTETIEVPDPPGAVVPNTPTPETVPAPADTLPGGAAPDATPAPVPVDIVLP